MISVIGAGLAGNAVAYQLAKQKIDVAVYEEHNQIGKPVHCTGLVSNYFSRLVELKKEFVLNKINTYRIYAPNAHAAEIHLTKQDFVLDRAKFDSYLYRKAEKAGAMYFLNHSFVGIENNTLKVIDKKRRLMKVIQPEIIIGADGALSAVAKSAFPVQNRKYFTGIQARAFLDNDNSVEVILNKKGFAWIVPESRNIVRMGCISEDNPKKLFDDCLKRIKAKDIIETYGGVIPIYDPRRRFQCGRVFLVGDAAGFAKASTGGGIIQSLICGKICADSIVHGKDYHREIKNKMGKELYLSLAIHRMLSKFSESDYTRLIELCRQQRINQILGSFSRDFPVRMLAKLIKAEPRFLNFARYAL